jgi:putative hydrolases of HD superfamily
MAKSRCPPPGAFLQAREYEEQGHANVQPWIDTSIDSLQTATAKALAAEAVSQNTLDWLERAKQTPPNSHATRQS